MFYQFNSLGEALKAVYPEYDWDMSKFSFKGKKSTQRWLYVKLKKLLPNTEIIEEYHHPELLWEGKKRIVSKKKHEKEWDQLHNYNYIIIKNISFFKLII